MPSSPSNENLKKSTATLPPLTPTRSSISAPSINVNNLARLELISLQRQYRLLEGQRQDYSKHGSAAQVQVKILQFLKDEKEDLQSDLKNAVCPVHKAKATMGGATILKFIERYEQYKRLITKQIKDIKELEVEGNKIKDKVVRQKLKILSVYGHYPSHTKITRNLQIWEDKLYIMTTKFNDKCKENLDLREQISFYLRARARFHNRFKYIKKEIVQVKAAMLQLVQSAAASYDTRDEAVSKTKIIRERDIKECKQHVLEVKEYKRVLHNDKKMREFLSIKNHKRELVEDEENRRLRKEGKHEGEVDDMLKRYQESVETILKMTKSHSVDQLCAFYVDLEQKNHAEFQYITDLNNECAALMEAVKHTKERIDQTHMLIVKEEKRQRDTLTAKQKEALELEEKLKELTVFTDKGIERLAKLVQGVSTAFEAAECSDEYLIGILGNQQGFTHYNVELCISILDHRLRELVYKKRVLQQRKQIEIEGRRQSVIPKLLEVGGRVKNYGGPFKPELFATAHLGNEDEEDRSLFQKPLYFKEMKDFVSQQMVEAGLLEDKRVHTSRSTSVSVSTDVPSDTILLNTSATVSENRGALSEREETSANEISSFEVSEEEQTVGGKESPPLTPPPLKESSVQFLLPASTGTSATTASEIEQDRSREQLEVENEGAQNQAFGSMNVDDDEEEYESYENEE